MSVAEAVAIDRSLCLEEEDPERDVQAFKELSKWAERFSPLVGLEEEPRPESLLMDITGCAPCFRGEDRLLRRAECELAERGWTARLAIADTVGAAWGLARYRESPCLAPEGQIEKFLYPLPVAALRLPVDNLDVLRKLGLERIGQLATLPRQSLVSRFGPIILERLDQALGRLPEPLRLHRWIPPVQAACPFEPPTEQRQLLHYALDRLTGRIHEILQSRNWGARQIVCWLYQETAAPVCVEVNLFSPSQALPYLRMLLRDHLQRVPVREPISGMRLHVSRTEPLSDRQAALFETQDVRLEELSALIDRLGSRLGYEAVTRPVLVADAQPEYACRLEPLIQTTFESGTRTRRSKPVQGNPQLLPRPLRLWPRPIRVQVMAVVPDGPPVAFRWEGVDYRITRAWGPERIETGWWRCQEVQRDYYVVVTHLGNRFWLFRHRDDGHWFMHGCFD
jgi:protein ImuB